MRHDPKPCHDRYLNLGLLGLFLEGRAHCTSIDASIGRKDSAYAYDLLFDLAAPLEKELFNFDSSVF